MDKLRLEVLMKAVDKVTGPLESVMAGSSATSRKLNELRDSYKQLEQQQGLIGAFRNAHKASNGLRSELTIQQAKIKALAAENAAAGTVTTAMAGKMEQARGTAAALKSQLQQQQYTMQSLRDRMGQAGISTSGLAGHERGLRDDIERTSTAIAQQKQRLQTLHDARQKASRWKTRGAEVAGAGMAMVKGASHAINSAVPLMDKAKTAATEELKIRARGLKPEDADDALAYANNLQNYGTSKVEHLALIGDAIAAFDNNVQHAKIALPTLAKMKFTDKVTGEGDDKKARMLLDMHKVIAMRNGMNSHEDYEREANGIQKAISANGEIGKPEEWSKFIKSGDTAVKVMKAEDFYGLNPLVHDMGGHALGKTMASAYENLYQGNTTQRAGNLLNRLGLIADRSKVDENKAGQIKHISAGAIKGSDIFERNQLEWIQKILLPALKAKGITDEKGIQDAIGDIYTSRTGARLSSDRAQKIAEQANAWKPNTGADDISTRNELAKKSPVGTEVNLRARRDDLELGLGRQAMPLYVTVLEKLTAIIEKVTEFTQKNPGMTQAIIYAGAAFAGLSAVVGTVLIPIGFILMKVALMHMWLARMGLAAAGSAEGMGLLGKAFDFARQALGGGLWPILKNFLKVGGITTLIWALVEGISTFIEEWDGTWQNLGSAIWKGIEAGLNAATFGIYGFVKQAIGEGTSTAAQLQGTARATAGAAALAEATKSAIPAPADMPKVAAARRMMAEASMVEGTSIAPSARALHTGQVNLLRPGGDDTKLAPMLAMAPRTAAAPTITTHNAITIHAAPGMDTQELTRAVSTEMDRRERAGAARRYSAMSDGE